MRVDCCPRCGMDHDDLDLQEFSYGYDTQAERSPFKGFAMCPTTHEPIIITRNISWWQWVRLLVHYNQERMASDE